MFTAGETDEGYGVVIDYKTGEAIRTFTGGEVWGYLCYLNEGEIIWERVG